MSGSYREADHPRQADGRYTETVRADQGADALSPQPAKTGTVIETTTSHRLVVVDDATGRPVPGYRAQAAIEAGTAHQSTLDVAHETLTGTISRVEQGAVGACLYVFDDGYTIEGPSLNTSHDLALQRAIRENKICGMRISAEIGHPMAGSTKPDFIANFRAAE